MSSKRLDLTPILLTFSIIIAIALLFLGVYKENTEFKSIEVYNANGTLLTTLEGRIHNGFTTYINLEDDTVMLPNSNFTYIEKELVD